jgi:hypothetical protein
VTGPEHYKAAERLLDETVEYAEIGNVETEAVAHAQVHATLALAAATALSRVKADDEDDAEWVKAASKYKEIGP